jgi:hypothetical protein
MKLAVRVAESVPLDGRAALNLLYLNESKTGDADLAAHCRLRVVDPIWYQPGVGLMAEDPYTVTGHDYTLNVTGKSTDNLAGYETTIYSITPKVNQIGYVVAALYTDRHINGKTEHVATPTADYLRFPLQQRSIVFSISQPITTLLNCSLRLAHRKIWKGRSER